MKTKRIQSIEPNDIQAWQCPHCRKPSSLTARDGKLVCSKCGKRPEEE